MIKWWLLTLSVEMKHSQSNKLNTFCSWGRGELWVEESSGQGWTFFIVKWRAPLFNLVGPATLARPWTFFWMVNGESYVKKCQRPVIKNLCSLNINLQIAKEMPKKWKGQRRRREWGSLSWYTTLQKWNEMCRTWITNNENDNNMVENSES